MINDKQESGKLLDMLLQIPDRFEGLAYSSLLLWPVYLLMSEYCIYQDKNS